MVDLPTAFYITAAEIKDAKIVGQLPAGRHAGAFGLVLDKGSPLTACVSTAVDGAARRRHAQADWRRSGSPRWRARPN